MKNILNFPDDYIKTSHRVVPDAVQYMPLKDKFPVFISVVGGGTGLYGDGENSFELMIGNTVHGYLTAKEVDKKVNKVLRLIYY